MNNQRKELTNKELSNQMLAEEQLNYSRLHDSQNNIEQKVNEAGNLYFKNDNGEWELFED